MDFDKCFVFAAMLLLSFMLLTGCTGKKDNANSDNSQIKLPSSGNKTMENAQKKQQDEKIPDSDPGVSEKSKFKFGIEYAVPGLASTYAQTGAHAAKPTPALVMWDKVQSSKGAAYDWNVVDAHVKEYQDAGFDSIQLLITAESKWASRSAAKIPVTDTRPKPEYEKDYVKFVAAAVERYDNDGMEDMPGLKYPIDEWGVEREFTGFWPGSGSEYVELLKLAYPAIKTANQNSTIMLNALLMWDIFQGNPSEGEIKNRLASPPGGKRKDISDVHVLLDAVDYYDAIDFHSLGDYSEIPATVKWLKKEMEARGAEKKIFIGDAFPMSPLLGYGFETCEVSMASAKTVFPVTCQTRCEAAALITKLRKGDAEAKAWLEKNVAIGLVKKYAVASGEGIAGINIGNLEDWEVLFAGAGTSQYFGMIDRTVPLGDQLKVKRIAGEKRPAFFALEMIIKNLDGFDSVERLDYNDVAVYVYEFTNSGKKTIVAWYDDGKFYGLGKATPEKEVEIAWQGDAMVKEILTVRGQIVVGKEFASKDGKLALKLDYVPVFIAEK